MNRVRQEADVQVTLWIQLTEVELRALDALAGYGDGPFLKALYETLGQSYIRPHESGVRSLFATVRDEVPAVLRRAKDARKAFNRPRRIDQINQAQIAVVPKPKNGIAAFFWRFVPKWSRS